MLAFDDEICGANEEYNTCGRQCQKTCADVNKPEKPCSHMCTIGCFCIEGFVRQSVENKSCVNITEC